MNFSYSEAFKSLPASQQQQLSQLQPEVAAQYLFSLQQQNKKKKRATNVVIAEDDATNKKRRKGSDPRKCYNPSCDRIVTKRNYCYKCQKRKERGLALNPKLPSIKQLLLPSDKKNKNVPNDPTSIKAEELCVPQINNKLQNIPGVEPSGTVPTTPNPNPFSFSSFCIPPPSFRDQTGGAPSPHCPSRPGFLETVLSPITQQLKDIKMRAQSPSSTPLSREPVSAPQLTTPTPLPPVQSTNLTPFNSMPSLPLNSCGGGNSGSNGSCLGDQKESPLQNLHQYLLHLSNGSEEKASSLLNEYLNSRNGQPLSFSTSPQIAPPTTPGGPFSSSPSPAIPTQLPSLINLPGLTNTSVTKSPSFSFMVPQLPPVMVPSSSSNNGVTPIQEQQSSFGFSIQLPPLSAQPSSSSSRGLSFF